MTLEGKEDMIYLTESRSLPLPNHKDYTHGKNEKKSFSKKSNLLSYLSGIFLFKFTHPYDKAENVRTTHLTDD